MISREQLEMNQVWLYALALIFSRGFMNEENPTCQWDDGRS